MSFDPLPTPSSLVDPAVAIDSALAQAEIALRQQPFVSSMGNIAVQANGTVELDFITVNDAAFSTESGWPIEMIRTLCQEALSSARAASEAAMSSLVSGQPGLSLPGVPGIDDATPNWAGFAGAVDALFAQADYVETKLGSMAFIGSAGPIKAVVNASLDLQQLTLAADAEVETGIELGQYVREAVNQGLSNAKNLLDDYIYDNGPSPEHYSLPSVVLFASSVLKIGAGVQLKQADGSFASSANAGVAETSFGAGAQVGGIWSRAKVTLAGGVQVNGSVRTCDVVEEQDGVVVTGETKEHVFIDAPVLSLGVAFPAWSSGDINVEVGSQAGQDPGSYNNVTVNSGATLRLSGGVYYFQTFTLESAALLVLSGPVTIFVSGSIVFRGTVGTPSGARPEIAIGYTGSTAVSFESRFDGVMVAPYAKVNLESVAAPGYSGAFFANEIEVAQGTVVTDSPGPTAGIPYGTPETPPQAPAIAMPTGLLLSPGDQTVNISWNPVAGATGYNIYYGTAPGLTTASQHVQTATNSYQQSNLANGTTYYYRVSAVGTAGESPLSIELSVVPQIPAPGMPEGVTATAGDTKVAIAWNSVPTAASYNIYWATKPGVTKNGNRLENKTSPYLHDGRSNGVTYYYRVSAVNVGGEGPLSDEASATPQIPAPSAPTGLTATPGNGVVTIAWNATPTATSYNIYYSITPGVTTASPQLPGILNSPYSHWGRTNGTRYYYRVAAVNAGGEGPLSTDEVSAVPQVSGPGVPGCVDVTPGNGRVTITWCAVSGATGYNIYWATTPGVTKGSNLLANKTSPYVHTGLTNGTKYYYRVSAVNAGGESLLSIEVNTMPQIPAPSAPTCVTATPGNAQVTVAWNAAAGATSYNLYYATSPGVTISSSKIQGVASPYLHTGRTNGTRYYYRVSAVNAGGESPLSTEVNAMPQIPAPGAPTGVTATAGNAQVTVTWTAVSGATSYNLYYAMSPGVTIASSKVPGAASPYVQTGRTNGTTYYYRVSAVNAGGESALSSEVNATPQSVGSGILGFEVVGNWHTTGGTLTRVTSPRTQGAAAVQISGNGYAELTNTVALASSDVTITARFLIDLFIPTVQANPNWMGQLQLFFTCPSHSVFHQFVGQKDLTGLTLGAFHTIEIAVPANLRSALQGSFTDLTLGIALNVDLGCGPHVFDNIRFLT
jgi:fibronectin type 3 domain-containing protein/DNA-binding protein YbaB